ncbi:zinc-binding dehydrogenase [Pseudonocardia sp. GCM10023141]|uniref:zinc-binding dehydrogenase n=1 Tax=Pseudonocardia sp. GCM10023141 TaxID=3252653 RepID=UPI0036157074
MTTTAHRVTLSTYRNGTEPAADMTTVDKIDLASPAAGQVLVRTTFVQITAVLADLMREDPGLPMPGYALGEPVWAPAVGTVIESGDAAMPVGTDVAFRAGGQDHALLSASEVYPLPTGLPEPYYALNQGVTAFHGIVDIAEVGPDDVVFVSGAAGGVGSLAGQIAKARGARMVIGSAGSAAKVDYLVDELGFDAAINYRDGDIAGQLAALAPEGITAFFDTVGGTTFEAAVVAAAHGARFALCGALAGQLDDGVGAHPRLDVMTAIVKELVIKPFSTYHTPEQIQAWNSHYGQWLAEGRIVYPRTVVEGGIDALPGALDELLAGVHRGNLILRIAG